MIFGTLNLSPLSLLLRELRRPSIVGLAARAAHDFVGGDQRTRDLVAGEMRRAVSADLGDAGCGFPGMERDDGGHLLAVTLARQADDERIEHGRMALQHSL